MSRTGSFIKSEFIPTQCSCWRFTEVFHCYIGFFILNLVQLKETYRFIGKEKCLRKCLGKCLLDIREGNWVMVFKIDSMRRGNGCHRGVLEWCLKAWKILNNILGLGKEHCWCMFKSGACSSTSQTVGVSHLSMSVTDVEHNARASLWLGQ
jgi:hypothetical protein